MKDRIKKITEAEHKLEQRLIELTEEVEVLRDIVKDQAERLRKCNGGPVSFDFEARKERKEYSQARRGV